MKNILKVFGILIILLIVAMIVLPFLFKDEIKQVVKDAANNNLNAKVDFEDIHLSLFESFPNLAISVVDLSIINNAPFEGDTVFTAKSVGASVDVLSVISGDVLKIKSVSLDSPKIIMYILEDGSANYNIAKVDSLKNEISNDTVDTKSNFNIDLQSYSITNGRIAFIDQTTNIIVGMSNLNHHGNGDFSQDSFVLETETTIDEFTLEIDGIKYLNKVKSSLDMNLGVNLPNMKFILKDNNLSINNLNLKFDGSVSMPSDDIDIDLKFNSPSSEFKDIISLIPAIYKNNFADINSSGNMELAGFVNGTLSENKLPGFNIRLKVTDGNFQYPDLPTPVNNVNIDMIVSNKDGVLDNMVINLSKIHIELGSEPIDGMLHITNPETGPIVETKIKGKIDLANIKSALDLKNINKLEGIILSDFEAKGNISTTTTNYENINATGNILATNVIYESNDFKQNVNISNASLNFTPKNIRLNNFIAKIGESDIKVNGSLKNLISFVLSDGILIGNLNVTSNYFDFNPYLTNDEDKELADQSSEAALAAFDIPQNINFSMNSSFKKLLYDNLELTNVTGQIKIRESKISLDNLKMNLLQGSLSGNGYYAKSEYQENPDIQFKLNIKDFNIKQTYDSFISVKQFAPIAKYIEGSFSSTLKLNTALDNTLTPVWESFFSNGFLNLKTAEIKGFKPFTTVGSLLSLNELSNPKVQNVKPKFEIKNGRFYVSPVKYKIGNYNIVFSGSNGLDRSLDYVMEIDIPASQLKNQANSAISGLLGKDLNLVKSNTIKVKALIGGTIDSPEVKTSAADVASGIVEQVTDAIVDEAKEKVDSLKAELRKR